MKVILITAFLFSQIVFFAQNYSFLNSSFENYNGCVASMSPPHSQFGNVVMGWQNTLASNVATADFFTTSSSQGCSFTGFSSLTNTVTLASNTASVGCSWAGLYLNYYDQNSLNTKYREYISQPISLEAGVSYTLQIDLARSNHPSSNTLEVDFGIYGYNGSIPAGQSDYCLINSDGTFAPLFATINRAAITTTFQTFTVIFTPTQNYSHLVLGGANCGTDATAIGYVFIDNVQLKASNQSIVNPVIESCSSNGLCELKCFKQSFDLIGNTAPSSFTSTWGQSPNNPEQLTFLTPNASSTSIVGTGAFIPGIYEFYYTFSNGTTTVTDTARVKILDLTFADENFFTAGNDLNFCNGINDDFLMSREVYINSATPSNTDIEDNNATVWWSMIRNDGTEWIFPNGCNNANGTDEGDVYVTQYNAMNCNTIIPTSSNSNSPIFYFRNPQDTVVFIWHMEFTDQCNTTVYLEDSITAIHNDIDLIATSGGGPVKVVCEDRSMIVHQVTSDTNYYILNDNPNLTFNWSYTPQNGGLTIIDNTVSDSVVIMANDTGIYVIKVEVTDVSTGCTWEDIAEVSVVGCGNVSSGGGAPCFPYPTSNDISGQNYAFAEKNLSRRINMNASPDNLTISSNGFGSWWSMIRNDGTEWVFPNNCVPSDGFNEGDVTSLTAPSPCSSPTSGSPSASDALFNFKNAMDTVTFIWHVTQFNAGTGITDTLVDSITIYVRDFDFPYSSYENPEMPWKITCDDTMMIRQYVSPSFRPLANDTNLYFKWEVVKKVGNTLIPDPSTTAYFVDDAVSDSALLVTSSAKRYRVMVTVIDTISGCQWMDAITVKRITPIEINAGSDYFGCNASTGDFIYQADASIQYQGTESDTLTTYSTWWSTIRNDGSEWTFPNNCVAFDGADEGDVYVLSPESGNNCNSELTDTTSSISPTCVFGLRFPGVQTLIWNALDPCTGEIKKDTIIVGYGVIDTADAGQDFTVSCNVVTLEGNISSLSSANTGYYTWRQITGVDSVSLLNSSGNIAYFSSANLTPGVYEFEYTLGLTPCQTTDTVAITVVPTPNVHLSMTSNYAYQPPATICYGDSITFTASGGTQYAFLVNGVIEQPFSPIGTFTFSNFLPNITNNVTVLGKVGQNNCIETLDSAHLVNVIDAPKPNILSVPNSICEGDTIVVEASNVPDSTSFSYGQYTWIDMQSSASMNVLSYSFPLGGTSFSSSGNYSVYYSAYVNNGQPISCISDSSFFSIAIYPVEQTSITQYICPGDSLFLEGAYQQNAGVYTDTLQSVFSCDSIILTNLLLLDTIVQTVEICQNDSVYLGGGYQQTAGVYFDNYTSVGGCDSTVSTTLIVYPIFSTDTNATICFEDSIWFNNTYYSTSGIYTNSLQTLHGCDSLIVLNLNVLPAITLSQTASICEGDSLLIFNQYEKIDSTYVFVSTAQNGCDSTNYFSLIVNPVKETNIFVQKCEGDSAWVENDYQTQNGWYSDTLSTSFGCDSIVRTNLIFNPNYLIMDTVVNCGAYYWSASGINYSQNGNYVAHLQNQYNCDSTIQLNLQVLPIDTTEVFIPFYCDSAFFKNQWYYQTQIVVDTLNGTDGCDSIVLTYLDIRDCSITSDFSDLHIPNVFTPDNDGKNDTFIITSKGEIIKENAELVIYNRWGTKIYETTTIMLWDGENHSEGTYYYIFKYNNKDYHGHLNLIRE